MQVNFDRNNKRTVRLTKPEIKILQKAETILGNLVNVEPDAAAMLDSLELGGLATLVDALSTEDGEEEQGEGAEDGNES